MDIVGRRNIFFTASGIAIGLAVLAMLVFGFRFGIDFEGGTIWKFTTSDGGDAARVAEVFAAKLNVPDARVTYDASNRSFAARLPIIEEAKHREYAQALSSELSDFQELEFQSIGPSVGAELRTKALMAIAFVLIGISLYIAFAFRKASYPVKSWKYGTMTLLSLFHDVIIPAGLLAALGRYAGIEIDTNFIVALLVVMGFSVHDTIVVFDRIRENLSRERGKKDFAAVINESVNQTIARSIYTSVTLILVLVALYVAGPETLKYFVLTLLVGVSVGTYSSVFIASPALLLTAPKRLKR